MRICNFETPSYIFRPSRRRSASRYFPFAICWILSTFFFTLAPSMIRIPLFGVFLHVSNLPVSDHLFLWFFVSFLFSLFMCRHVFALRYPSCSTSNFLPLLNSVSYKSPS
ncbi:hypothetical protein M407DRAFT_172721 [Tulasnella calospora MUT 4182]|uniref:Uncharacterized protein n=1 Tax=Tulasnella calospora MUT 4182 TaxID=1051891 RepID=A0A0C3QDN3_9AGAM|nr:hypothetical protein M407DRAFT_172721 [Tulasnella calospora MUT 4182]